MFQFVSLFCSSFGCSLFLVVVVVVVVVVAVVVVVVVVAVVVLCVVVVVVVFSFVSLILALPPFVRACIAGTRSLLIAAAGEGSGAVRYRTSPGT